MSNKVFLSEVTIKRHVSSILRKTKTQNRAELVNRFGLKEIATDGDTQDKGQLK